MPSTYTLISSNVLASSAASVTFSAIPSTYTDLVLRYSARTNQAGSVDFLNLKFNSTTSGYSYTRINVVASSVSSSTNGSQSYIELAYINGDTATSNSFAIGEIYTSQYANTSINKAGSHSGFREMNDADVFARVNAFLWSNTSAISTLSLAPVLGSNFVSGSSFYLYGIKNS